MKSISKLIGLFLLLIIPILIVLFLRMFGTNHFEVPVYYQNGVESSFTECNFGSTQHVIPSFELINQNNEPFSDVQLSNKLTVVDFFFTTCPSICPIMSDELTRVQKAYLNNEHVQIISISIDPGYDLPEILQAYAQRYGAMAGKWNFLTGDKKQIYSLARCGFVMPVIDGDGSPEDFIHSDKLVLIDAQKRIRGYYSGTNTEDVDRLIVEAKIILKEEF